MYLMGERKGRKENIWLEVHSVRTALLEPHIVLVWSKKTQSISILLYDHLVLELAHRRRAPTGNLANNLELTCTFCWTVVVNWLEYSAQTGGIRSLIKNFYAGRPPLFSQYLI